jgi:hypothetical protein
MHETPQNELFQNDPAQDEITQATEISTATAAPAATLDDAIERLTAADPADAPEIADEITATLAEQLESPTEESGS